MRVGDVVARHHFDELSNEGDRAGFVVLLGKGKFRGHYLLAINIFMSLEAGIVGISF